MSFNNNLPRIEYTSNANQKTFTFLFKVYNKTDLVVYKTDKGAIPDDTADKLVLDTDYTVTINGDNGGSIDLITAGNLGDSLTLLRELPQIRDVEYQTNGDLLAEVLNDDQDYQTYLIADTVASSTRVITLSQNSQGVSNVLPTPLAEQYLRWNATGSALENDLTIPGSVGQAKQHATNSQNSAIASGNSATSSAGHSVTAEQSATASAKSATSATASATSASNDKAHIDARLDLSQGNGKTVEENIDTITSDPVKTLLANAEKNATDAQKAEWKANAWELTAKSYAMEDEDVFVKLYTSNSDGTFSHTDSTDYSAKHWQIKASKLGGDKVSKSGDTMTGNLEAPSMTVAGVAVWSGSNDGSGSGLDADKLDGAELVDIAKKDDYATASVGGTIKLRVDGTNLYITTDGSNA